MVKVEDLTNGSKTKVTKICDICNKRIPNQSYNDITHFRERADDGLDRCFDCGKKRGGDSYNQVVDLTGISKSTLIREVKKRKQNSEIISVNKSVKEINRLESIEISSFIEKKFRC